jgi:hypothetical protein
VHAFCDDPASFVTQRSNEMPKLVRIVIQLPLELKLQLDELKRQGYTTSGFIRAMLERELQKLESKPPEIKRLPIRR